MDKIAKRIREWMDIPGSFQPGPGNAITDVAGVKCSHVTITGDGVLTGLTLISPCDGDNLCDTQLNPFFEACADAVQEALYNSMTMAKCVGEFPTLNLAEYLQPAPNHKPKLP
ncbi:MAG: hypothetical protein FWC77_04080 [Defluviitaleaceae bacterium]|nr:hypothetical protein [Defluviitaleaceae bacterium]